jgi:hypothetical protein
VIFGLLAILGLGFVIRRPAPNSPAPARDDVAVSVLIVGDDVAVAEQQRYWEQHRSDAGPCEWVACTEAAFGEPPPDVDRRFWLLAQGARTAQHTLLLCLDTRLPYGIPGAERSLALLAGAACPAAPPAFTSAGAANVRNTVIAAYAQPVVLAPGLHDAARAALPRLRAIGDVHSESRLFAIRADALRSVGGFDAFLRSPDPHAALAAALARIGTVADADVEAIVYVNSLTEWFEQVARPLRAAIETPYDAARALVIAPAAVQALLLLGLAAEGKAVVILVASSIAAIRRLTVERKSPNPLHAVLQGVVAEGMIAGAAMHAATVRKPGQILSMLPWVILHGITMLCAAFALDGAAALSVAVGITLLHLPFLATLQPTLLNGPAQLLRLEHLLDPLGLPDPKDEPPFWQTHQAQVTGVTVAALWIAFALGAGLWPLAAMGVVLIAMFAYGYRSLTER